MTKFGNDFVGQYSLSKTLRFELKPMGRTKEWLEKNNVFDSDEERANNYIVIKELLDQYYRFYIEQSLKNKKLTASLVEDAYEAYCKQDDKKTENLNIKLRKEVARFFNNKEKFGLKDYKNLLVLTAPKDKKHPSILVQWIDGNTSFSPKDKKKYLEAIKNFAGFTVYFTGYRQTRENMFADEAKATGIAYRIIDQNMYRFFANIKLYNKIAETYKDLSAKLKKQEEYFQPDAYCGILSQSAIDEYNTVLGQEIKNNETMGVNSIINEYRQKEGIKARNLPTMSILYKQILSEGTRTFALEQIENEQEAIELTKESYREAYEEIQKLKKLVKQNIDQDSLSKIFVKTQDASSISNALFGSWDVFRRAIADKINGMGKKETAAFVKRTKETISLQELWNIYNEYKDGLDTDEAKEISGKIDLVEYFNTPPELVDKLPIKAKETVKGYKENLDQIIASIQFYRGLYLYNKNKQLARPEDSEMFYNEFDEIYLKLRSFSKAYDKIRNFATKKSYSDQKFKLNFNVPTLLSGWDLNKETSSASSILLKDGKYYLAIINADNRKVLDLSCEEVQKIALAKGSSYQKMQYKQISDAGKDLATLFVVNNEVIRMTSGTLQDKKEAKKLGYTKGSDYVKEKYLPKEIFKIVQEESYKGKNAQIGNVKKYIQYKSRCALCYWKQFDLKLKPAEEYTTYQQFIDDIQKQGYMINFVDISSKYIDKLVAEGKLYLFQIYNKDFSDGKKKQGTDNLHTMYWKTLFSKENLAAIKKDNNMPIIKLNGEAEIFLRKASIKYKVTHPKNKPIENKNVLNPEKTSTFKYDLIKDKRYTEDKMFFHCPITINFRSQDNKSIYNFKVNSFIENNKDVNIIGIDRGERHLLYYTVVNQRGEILEQGSLNNIDYSYAKGGKAVKGRTNYRELLDVREKERADSRIAWNAVENIKELKAGYLSQVVHKLALLMVKYNAVIALENLNLNFKRGRIKVEKQVYQKFEKAIIDKLNYLVFKDRKYGEAGSVSNGYQLTAPFESFEKLGRQTGCIYYVIPSYTSHIDPKTGFVNLLNSQLRYESVEKAKDMMNKWDGVHYNAKTKVFVFDLDYTKFNIEMFKTKWKICTNGAERYGYNGRNETSKKYNVTEELKTLFEKAKISFMDEEDILPDIMQQNDKAFWSKLLYMLRLTMQIRYTCTGTDNNNDYILSPVEYEKGKFFDSRLATVKEPQNADANGAYNIALKGLQMIRGIEAGVLHKPKAGEERNRWFKFMQAHEYKSK